LKLVAQRCRWAALVALALPLCGCLAGSGPTQRTSYSASYFPLAIDPVVQGAAELGAARELGREGNEACVDHYYRATMLAAQSMQANPGGSPAYASAWSLYHESLAELIEAGQEFGRLQPRRQVLVVEGGALTVPISYLGFAWQPSEFSILQRADKFRSRELTNHYVFNGLGAPLVAERISEGDDETFFRQRQPFAATGVLRPAADGQGAVLEFYNPLAINQLAWAGGQVPLARNPTAPLSAIVIEAPRKYLEGFTAPNDTSVKAKLVLVEPYQRGKIPVVFIHGLYSDAITWVDTFNDLRIHRDVYDQFQFWVFRYPTGGEVLDSAAVLRQQLALARATYDPGHTDPALDQTVLIGHSLGGLVAKMQMTTSYDILWRHVAEQPFDALKAPPAVEQRLARSFFFDPSPMVSRVVFIGTPHRGSALARRAVGLVSRSLVQFGEEEDEQYRELMEENPDVFRPIVARRRPTTIDMLDPDSPLLEALLEMPMNPRVRTNSIIGTGGVELLEPGDGVVPVVSARQCGVESEILVPAKHEKLHRDPLTAAELLRILRKHAAEGAQPVVAGVPSGPRSVSFARRMVFSRN